MYSDDTKIIQISSILGLNVLFDNLIYSIKAIHTAERTQFLILKITLIESFIKLSMVVVFYFRPFNFLLFLFLLVACRIFTLILSYRSLPLHVKIEIRELKTYINIRKIIKVKRIRSLIYEGRVFVIIGSINVIFWRINSLLLSKLTDKTDVGNYEVAFKLFSIAQIIPVILMGTIYPVLSKNNSDNKIFLETSKKAYLQLLIFSVYTSLSAFFLSPYLITWFFGTEFKESIVITQHMFLALIPFSLSLVQAYILIASHHEKIDMWLNIINLIINSILGYILIKSFGLIGSVYSISISFLLFYIIQSVFLKKYNIDYLSKEKFKILVVIIIPIIAFILSVGKYVPQLNEIALYFITLTFLTIVLFAFKIINKHIFIKS
jgi:O-antigen/teichoic acid export membrane protein